MENELTQAESSKIVESVADAVFKGEAVPTAEQILGDPPETIDTAGTKTETPPDPWKDIPTPIRTEFDSLRKDLEEGKKVSYRLSQAEKRIGSLDSRNKELEKILNEEREARRKQPTPEQVEKEKRAKVTWDNLKIDSPDIAEAVELYIQEQTGKSIKAEDLPNILNPLRDEIVASLPKQEGAVTRADVIEAVHPGWEAEVFEPIPGAPVDPSTGKQPIRYNGRFMEFIKAKPEYEKKCESPSVGDAVEVLSAFKSFKPQKTAADIKAEQAERLRQSAGTETGTKGKRSKSVDDMTPEEIREMVASKVYAAA